MNFLKEAFQDKPLMIDIRRKLHQIPEIGMDTFETANYIKERLREIDCQPIEIGNSGVAAVIGRDEGKTILLRADMDAVPIIEENNEQYASKKTCSHLCGHDFHTTILLETAKLLKEYEEHLPGKVKLMFQPGEEIFLGALDMIENGILDFPAVDYAFGLHMLPGKPVGDIYICRAATMASCNNFKIKIYGKGAHGAQPQESVDPVNIAVHITLALQSLVAREISAQDAVTLSITSIQAGNTHNVIPKEAEIQGTLRTFDESIRTFILKRIQEISSLTAQMFCGSSEFVSLGEVPVLYNDSGLADILYETTVEILGPEHVHVLPVPTNISEDFAEISSRVPSMFFFLGSGTSKQTFCESLHSPYIQFDEEALPFGAAIMAEFTIRALKK